MKRLSSIVSLVMALALAAPVAAHPVVVDGDPADWNMPQPRDVDTGHISRDATHQGEYVWVDAVGDERTNFGTPDRRVDITELRITGDAANLYILVRMDDIDLVSGDGAPQIQIAIDQDYTPGSGQLHFGMLADTQVEPNAAWERLIVTRFGSGSQPQVFDQTFTDQSSGSEAAVISDTHDVIEISIPWTALGSASHPDGPYMFTVVSLRANASDEAWDIAGQSDVLDCITNYGDPGLTANTWDEVGDGDVDYTFQIYFHLDPDMDPSPPLVINEFLVDAATEPEGEWIEIYNRAGSPLPVATVIGARSLSLKVGDEELVGAGEGMYSFPGSATIPVGDVVVIANEAATFVTEFSAHPVPDYELNDSDATPDMVKYSTWASGSVNLNNAGDDVLLLDYFDTIIDVVRYGAGSPWPGVTGRSTPAVGASLERPQIKEDSNDMGIDFVEHDPGDITPGVVFAALALGDGCSEGGECTSGYCANGVCCTTACDGVCDGTCNSSGVCQPLVCPSPTDDCDLTVCDPTTGCSLATGSTCDDHDACTTGTQCNGAGACVGGAAVTCPTPADDCDLAVCDSVTGCIQDVGTSCDDGSACTTGTQCDAAGACTGGSAVVCATPADDCDLAVCDATTGCIKAVGVACDDGDACTTGLQCDAAGACAGGSAVVCPTPGDDCHIAVCDSTTGCNAASGTPCDDSDVCTGATQCDGAGACAGGTGTTCPTPTNECMFASCDAALGCSAATGTACDDGDLCTTGATCDATGMCNGGTAVTCPTPTNDCMLATCNGTTGCVAAASTTCDDGDACTTGTTCDASGMCGGGTNTCVDAGVPDSGVTPDSGTGTDASTGPDAGTGDDDDGGGCGCRQEGSSGSLPVWVLFGALLWWVRRRRR